MDLVIYAVPFQLIWFLLHLNKSFLFFFMEGRDMPDEIAPDSLMLFSRNNFYGRIAIYIFVNLCLCTIIPFLGLFSSFYLYYLALLFIEVFTSISIFRKDDDMIEILKGLKFFTLGLIVTFELIKF